MSIFSYVQTFQTYFDFEHPHRNKTSKATLSFPLLQYSDQPIEQTLHGIGILCIQYNCCHATVLAVDLIVPLVYHCLRDLAS